MRVFVTSFAALLALVAFGPGATALRREAAAIHMPAPAMQRWPDRRRYRQRTRAGNRFGDTAGPRFDLGSHACTAPCSDLGCTNARRARHG